MKNVLTLGALLCVTLFTSLSQDSDIQESRIRVNGLCGMCKTRIEKTVKIEGVKKAQWSKTTKLLTVSYQPSLIAVDSLQRRLASVGHDTERYKAADSVYSALPGCCRYRTGSTH
jgi:hypothetical protein